jgi:hypothetical protein
VWQPPLERSRAIRALAIRETVHCNWNAQKGETVETLEFENLVMYGERTVAKDGMNMPAGLWLPDERAVY